MGWETVEEVGDRLARTVRRYGACTLLAADGTGRRPLPVAVHANPAAAARE
jgi:hypothetical protein